MTPDIDCVWQHPPAIVRKAPKVAAPATVPVAPRHHAKKPKHKVLTPAPEFVGCDIAEPPAVLIPPPDIPPEGEEQGGFSPVPEGATPPTFEEGSKPPDDSDELPTPEHPFAPEYPTPPGHPIYPVHPSVPPTPAIPEPSTFALLLAGLGVMGFLSRRRTR